MYIMESTFRKMVAFVLVGLVLVLISIGILSVWEIINLEHLMSRLLRSLFIVFVGAVVILFIFAVLVRDNDRGRRTE